MKKILTIVLALMMCLSMAACSSGPDKKPAIEAFNAASNAHAALATAINENPEGVTDETIASLTEIAEMLAEHKTALESNKAFTQEELDSMIEWYNMIQDVMADVKADYGLE